jgi:hypothetical protein
MTSDAWCGKFEAVKVVPAKGQDTAASTQESRHKPLDTYVSAGKAQSDKAQLLSMLIALDGARNSIKLDECRTFVIRGRQGYVATWGDGKRWLVHCAPGSPRKWTNIRRALSPLGQCTQDGGQEGIIRIDRRPNPDEAALIRKAIRLNRTKRAPGNAFKTTTAKSPVGSRYTLIEVWG